jgi:DNA-binding transcriptional ArsR family regulator
MSDDPVEERREMLEQLADRNELNVSKYAKALLDGD